MIVKIFALGAVDYCPSSGQFRTRDFGALGRAHADLGARAAVADHEALQVELGRAGGVGHANLVGERGHVDARVRLREARRADRVVT